MADLLARRRHRGASGNPDCFNPIDISANSEQARITELAVLFVLLTAACFLVFGDPDLIPVRLHVLAFAVLPFVIWAAVRFEVMGAGLSVLLIATIATLGTALGSGPFATSTPFTNAVLLDAFFGVLSVTGIALSSAIAEREQAHREREQSVREHALLAAKLEAEQVVRASEERLRLAQQAARIGSFERDVQTGVVTWTPEMELIYGLPPGGFDGSFGAFENLVHPDDRVGLIELVDAAFSTKQATTGEWRVVWPDGSVHWILGCWQVLTDQYGKPSRVVGVNIDVTERKRGEEALLKLNRTLEAQTALLQSREELLKIFVKNVPAGVAMLDREMCYLQVSDRWCADYSVDSSQILGCSHYDVFPDMPEHWKAAHRRALDGETLRADEDKWDREDGTTWLRWEILPWSTSSGSIGGILIFAEDITRRKLMEDALSGMSRKLIESQEQERARIGRELHDDINQQLAMLAVELGQLQENPSEPESRVQELRKKVIEISNDVQALSHDLHSSKLEYLGAVAGIKSWCREFAERQKVDIEFRSSVKSALPLEVGRTLFRVLQEGLHNSIKHSGVRQVQVQMLEDEASEIHLVVADTGQGFDLEAALQGQGLGLTSMQERVRLLNGSIEIQSKPMGGTTIHVRVPIGSEHRAQRAAG